MDKKSEKGAEKKSHNEITLSDAVDDIEQSEARMDDNDEGGGESDDVFSRPDNMSMPSSKRGKLSRKKKLLFGIVALFVLIGAVAAIPFMRYGVMGMMIKKSVSLQVVDAGSQRPVSGVKITISRLEAITDQKGIATFSGVSVGEHYVTFEKKNYNTAKTSITVPIFKDYVGSPHKLTANGRTVELKFVDSISGAIVKGVSVATEGATTIVDDSGIVSMAFAPAPVKQPIGIKAKEYNDTSILIDTSSETQQVVKLVPSGRIAFLSNRSGTISVMTSLLDGSDVREIVKGTGKELSETTLVTSPDRQYATLLSRRDGGDRQRLYTINLTDGSIRLADDRTVSIQLIGWIDGSFYYQASLNDGTIWQDKTSGVFRLLARTNERQVIDETVGMGTNYLDYATETLSSFYIMGNTLVYAKTWNYAAYYRGDRSRPVSFMSIEGGAGARSVLKQVSIPNYSHITSTFAAPDQILFRLAKTDQSAEVYQYKQGSITKTALTSLDIDELRTNYYPSPSGTKILWGESRDGKSRTFIANTDMSDRRELSGDTYMPYGWVGDEYILYSKNRSELFIAPVAGPLDGSLKVADYYKPAYVSYPGYPSGY